MSPVATQPPHSPPRRGGAENTHTADAASPRITPPDSVNYAPDVEAATRKAQSARDRAAHAETLATAAVAADATSQTEEQRRALQSARDKAHYEATKLRSAVAKGATRETLLADTSAPLAHFFSPSPSDGVSDSLNTGPARGGATPVVAMVENPPTAASIEVKRPQKPFTQPKPKCRKDANASQPPATSYDGQGGASVPSGAEKTSLSAHPPTALCVGQGGEAKDDGEHECEIGDDGEGSSFSTSTESYETISAEITRLKGLVNSKHKPPKYR
jgi:hypothetical protein